MKNERYSRGGFFNLRILLSLFLGSVAGLLAIFSFAGVPAGFVRVAEPLRMMPLPDGDGNESDDLNRMEEEWHNRLTYPTGKFDPAWVRRAVEHDATIARDVPFGLRATNLPQGPDAPLALDATAFTALGPQPERMTGCFGCTDYGTTSGRVNSIAIDPTTTTNGSIVAYIATVGGGIWKTTNCCSGATNWTVTTDNPLITTTSIDSLVIDPSDHNT